MDRPEDGNVTRTVSSLHIDNASERDSSPRARGEFQPSNSTNEYLAIPSPLSSPPGRQRSTNLPLLAACYISALTVGATTYAFSFYSNDLKTSLDLSQNQLDTLSSSTFCAGVFSWLPGMVVDAWGARRAMALGGTSNAIMLGLYWAIATERLELRDVDSLIVLLSALGVVTFMGCALITGSVFKVIVESCASGTKGKAVGCAKGYVGVGSGVYVCLFGALFGTSTSGGGSDSELKSLNFLLMAAVLSFLAATLPALLLLPMQSSTSSMSAYKSLRDGTRDVHFRVVYVGLISLGVWVVGTSLMNLRANEQSANNDGASVVSPSILNEKPLSESDPLLVSDGLESITVRESYEYSRNLGVGNAFIILLLWWGPALSLLCLPPRKEFDDDSNHSPVGRASSTFNCDDPPDEDNLEMEGFHDSVDPGISLEEEDAFVHVGIPTSSYGSSNDGIEICGDHFFDARDRGFTLLQMLRTTPAWLMAWTYVILVGGGTLMTTNIGQMTEALGFGDSTTSASLALFSAAQGASRVCTGIMSEMALGWTPRCCGRLFSSGDAGVPRPVFLALASLIGAAAHFVLAISTSEGAFVFGVTLAGVSFGMVWPMMVLITGEVFGNRHVGANYMWYDGMSSAVGTLLFSKFVAQEVYDEHIAKSDVGDSDGATASAASDEDNFKCIGLDCFAMTHAIVSLLSLTCVLSSFALIRSTRDVHRNRQ